MAGVPEDFALQPSDQVQVERVDDNGRALPDIVVDQLLAPEALAFLEALHGADLRVMVELQADVGRRTDEICRLRWNCLTWDETVNEHGEVAGAPVLVHDMPKVRKRACRLPITADAAQLIRAQQDRVRAAYPTTPTDELALFPKRQKNLRGTKPVQVMVFCWWFRRWIDALPTLTGPGREAYDRGTITAYSFRHTYARRHADAGTQSKCWPPSWATTG